MNLYICKHLSPINFWMRLFKFEPQFELSNHDIIFFQYLWKKILWNQVVIVKAVTMWNYSILRLDYMDHV